MLKSRLRTTATITVSALVVALGAMHLILDGLTGVLIPLQPTLGARTGAAPATRWGEGRVAILGGVLAASGYGMLPAAGTPAQAAAAVVVGGAGSALFHPGAGALVVRAAPLGGEALPLAMFSAVGTGGAALVPLAVLSGVDSLGGAAALPFATALAALAVGMLFSRVIRTTSGPVPRQPAGASARRITARRRGLRRTARP